MKIKHSTPFIGAVIALGILLFCTSCSKTTPLPSFDIDVPPSIGTATIEPSTPSHEFADVNLGQNPTTEPSFFNEGEEITTESTKNIFSSLIVGDFESVQDGDFIRHTAPLVSGGTLCVVSYNDQYYQSEIRMPSNAAYAENTINQVLAAYIYRPLASSEIKELQNILGYIANGSPYELFSAVSNSAEVYIMIENDELVTQIK